MERRQRPQHSELDQRRRRDWSHMVVPGRRRDERIVYGGTRLVTIVASVAGVITKHPEVIGPAVSFLGTMEINRRVRNQSNRAL